MIDELRRFARGEAYDEQVMPEFNLGRRAVISGKSARPTVLLR